MIYIKFTLCTALRLNCLSFETTTNIYPNIWNACNNGIYFWMDFIVGLGFNFRIIFFYLPSSFSWTLLNLTWSIRGTHFILGRSIQKRHFFISFIFYFNHQKRSCVECSVCMWSLYLLLNLKCFSCGHWPHILNACTSAIPWEWNKNDLRYLWYWHI